MMPQFIMRNIRYRNRKVLGQSLPRFSGQRRYAGAIGKELSALLPSMIALALAVPILSFLVNAGKMLDGSLSDFPEAYIKVFYIMMPIVGLLCGTLCGAEEFENRTIGAPLVLPVSRRRILYEKCLGAFYAMSLWFWITWFMGAVVIDLFLSIVLSSDTIGSTISMELWGGEEFFSLEPIIPIFTWPVVLFFSSLASGIIIGRAIPAAIVGGLVPGVLLLFAAWLRSIIFDGVSMSDGVPLPLFIIADLAALAVAVISFQRKEIR